MSTTSPGTLHRRKPSSANMAEYRRKLSFGQSTNTSPPSSPSAQQKQGLSSISPIPKPENVQTLANTERQPQHLIGTTVFTKKQTSNSCTTRREEGALSPAPLTSSDSASEDEAPSWEEQLKDFLANDKSGFFFFTTFLLIDGLKTEISEGMCL